jgi:hypothetical protein
MVRSLFARYARFATAPAAPVISPFRKPVAPHRAMVRKFWFFTACIFIGMAYGFSFTLFPLSFIVVLALPILVLALVVVWALPDQNSAPTATLTGLTFALLILIVMWPNYLALSLPGLPWISVRRLFSPLVTFVLLICISTSARFRAQLSHSLRSSKVIYYGMVTFAIMQFVTLAWSKTPFSAMFPVIDHEFIWTGMFFAAAWVFTQPGMVRRYAVTVLAMALMVSLIGLVELKNQQILWARHIPSFLQVSDDVIERILTPQFRDGRYRISSTFGLSLTFSEYLALTTPFLLHFLFRSKSILIVAVWLAIDFALMMVIYLSTARLGMVGWMSAHGFYILIWAFKRWRSSKADILGPALSIAIPVSLVLLVVGLNTVDALRNRTIGGGSTAFSDDGRKIQYHMAPPVLAKNPFGYGYGQGGIALGYVAPNGLLTVDSYLLTIILDYGVVGFFVFYGMMISAIIRGAKLAVEDDTPDGNVSFALAVSTAILVFLTTKLVLSQEENHGIYFVLLGMSCAIQSQAKPRQPRLAAP